MKDDIPFLYRLGYVVSVVSLLILTVGWGISFTTHSSTLYGLSIDNTPIGGMNEEQLTPIVQKKIEHYLETPLRLSLNDAITHVAPKELGIDLNLESNLSHLISFGKRGLLARRAIYAISSSLHPTDVSLIPSIDTEVLTKALALHFPNEELQANNASVYMENGEIIVKASSKGKRINRSKLLPELYSTAARLQSTTVILEIIDDVPSITTQEAGMAAKRAGGILSQAPISITISGVTESPETVLARNDIVEALRFTPIYERGVMRVVLDDEVIRDLLISSVAPALNRSPSNLRLSIESDETLSIERPSREGIAISISKENVGALIGGIATDTSPIELHAITMPAELTSNRLEELGITDVIGVGTTNFIGSPNSRKHNITVGAGLYDGLLLAPGEEFSFNKILGEVGPEQGYLPELVIKENKTIPEYGGGICQVSTTVFRTAALSGLEITQRYPHSYVVGYYGEPGFDATIYPPNPDFRFRNDTPGHLLIQTEVIGTIITFEFFGTHDDREVTILGPTVVDKQPDGSMRTVVRQLVERDDEIIREESFWSSYKSADLYPIIRNPLE